LCYELALKSKETSKRLTVYLGDAARPFRVCNTV
jgi:hypothetical protein